MKNTLKQWAIDHMPIQSRFFFKFHPISTTFDDFQIVS